MATLDYLAIMALDGYVEDRDGNLEWAAPDEEVHAFVTALARPAGTDLFGRKVYEVMSYWEDPAHVADESAAIQEFATVWRAADKVVFSRTLDDVATPRTRLHREFSPEAVRRLKGPPTATSR